MSDASTTRRRTIGLLALALSGALVQAAFAQQNAEPIRVGIIGLDTYHAVAFTQLLNNPKAEGDLAGVRVVAAFPAGSPDIPESQESLPKWTPRVKDYGVEIVDSIDALLKKVDAVLLESIDGRAHLEQIKPVLRAGKPVFIDRPMAASLADAAEIFRLAKEANVPIFSCSQHRYSPGFIGMRNHEDVGQVLGCDVYGGVIREPHHPDLVWHAIHGIETLFTIMGPGCRSVTRTQTDAHELITGVWSDGRVGTFRGIRQGAVGYSALVYGSKGIAPAGKYGYNAPVKGVLNPGRYMGYEGVCTEIARFFKTRKPPVSAEETLEIFAFMEAAEESKRQSGAPVTIDSVLIKAGAKPGRTAANP
jgi:predicted dehydrogenase